MRDFWGLGSSTRSQAWGSGMGAPSPGLWATREFLAPGKINHQKLSQRPLSESSWDPPNCQQLPALDALHETTNKTGTQTHPTAHRLPKVILSSQAPQNIPPDAVLTTRKTRSSLIHQNIGISPLHQEAYTTHWTNLTHWGQTSKITGTTNLSLQKGDPKHNKVSKMGRQRNTQQKKEQGKNPPDQTNEEEISSLPEKEFRVIIVKMIQSLGIEWKKRIK